MILMLFCRKKRFSVLIFSVMVDKLIGSFKILNLLEIGLVMKFIVMLKINMMILINCIDCCVVEVFLCKKFVMMNNRYFVIVKFLIF